MVKSLLSKTNLISHFNERNLPALRYESDDWHGRPLWIPEVHAQ